MKPSIQNEEVIMFKTRLLLLLAALTLLVNPLAALHFASWETSMGDFSAEIYDHLMPITGTNFINLARSGFYDGLIFHRVISGFMIQDGCPNGTGTGGPGYTIPDEYHPDLLHDSAGVLAMAKTSAPNSAGSQYYITLARQPHLDNNYSVFGRVVEGLDVVLAIGDVPTGANDKPITPVVIESVVIHDLGISNIYPDPSQIYEGQVVDEHCFVIDAYCLQGDLEYIWTLDGVQQDGTTDYLVCYAFSAGNHSLSCQVSSADYSHTIHWEIDIQGTANDDPIQPPHAFTLSPNPFQDSIRIKSAPGHMIRIYDLKGRLVKTMGATALESSWDGRNEEGKRCPSGMYLFTDGKTTRKGLLLK
ncbi:MAG: peptidylprolyl isomerase [Candidatus Cloacimonadaceae bacterium]